MVTSVPWKDIPEMQMALTVALFMMSIAVVASIWRLGTNVARLTQATIENTDLAKTLREDNGAIAEHLRFIPTILSRGTEHLNEIRKILAPMQRRYLKDTWVMGEQVSVRIAEAYSEKVKIIKALKDHAGLGLKEAKDVVENLPCIVFSGEKAKSEALKDELDGIGVVSEIVER